MMKRFYIKRIADYITIVHRPSHQIIMVGNMDEKMGKNIKKFINMTTKEFYRELHSLGLKFKTNKSYQEEVDKEKEDWYKGAWLYTTKQVLNHYKLKEDSIPEEDMPLEFIKELQKGEGTGWNIEPKEAPEEKEKPKKLLKKKKLPNKVKNEKKEVLVPYKSKQEVRRAYSGGEIDLDTFKKYMRELKI